jgi:hypothetical protein
MCLMASMEREEAQSPIEPAMTAAGIAARVRKALDGGDLEELSALLSPDVHWGAPGDPTPSCQNRSQVLQWYEKGRAAGRSAEVTDVVVHGTALLVGLRLNDGNERWQVLRVGPDGITDIRGFDERASATAQLGV